MEATLRLFKALPVEDRKYPEYLLTLDWDKFSEQSAKRGFVFDPFVRANYRPTPLVELVSKLYGKDAEQLNSAFHKSFAKVRDASMAQLVAEQVLHYLTTYGAEAIFGKAGHVYIPAEALDLPEFAGANLVVIRGLTKAELKVELFKLLNSGIALHEQTVADAVEVATFVGITPGELEQVKNKEAKAQLYDKLGLVPENAQEFLRFVVYKATGKSLLIKNRELVDALKQRDNTDLAKVFATFGDDSKLAEIFYRYKPLFLALRTTPELKQRVNRIRRLAPRHHCPMPEDFLNTVTARLARRDAVLASDLMPALANANIFRKIRLAYALKFRATEADSILYRVRNGKSYATEFSFDNRMGAGNICHFVMDSIVADIRPKAEGKRIYIPEGVTYALPATEKQFTGNLPSGTSVTVDDNMIVGVHWFNTERGQHTDLDLALTSAGVKIGWDASYRDGQNGIYFSGDITNAPHPNGAAELFHVGAQARGIWLLNLNYYNFSEGDPVPYRIFVGHESQRNVNSNFVIDPNKINALTNSVLDVKQKTLGIVTADDNGTRFIFAESALDNKISARNTAASDQARKFLFNQYANTISLNEVLAKAGAELWPEPNGAHINLAPESVDKTTILDLLT